METWLGTCQVFYQERYDFDVSRIKTGSNAWLNALYIKSPKVGSYRIGFESERPTGCGRPPSGTCHVPIMFYFLRIDSINTEFL